MINAERLKAALEAEGLEIAEEAVAKLVEVLFVEVQQSAMEGDNQLLKGVAALLPVIQPILISELVDQIDGEDDR
jgi:hypothetical protein